MASRRKAKGWFNEPIRHSKAAKGIKTAQKLNYRQLKQAGFDLKPTMDDDRDGVPNSLDCKPLDPTKHKDMPVTEIGDFTAGLDSSNGANGNGKVGSIAKKIGRGAIAIGAGAFEAGKSAAEAIKERREKAKEQALMQARHPTVVKLQQQRNRVDELRTQLATEDDAETIEELDTELDREEEQLRTLQEQVTAMDIAQFSDRELKEFAVRFEEGIFGGNPFKKELIRRTESRKKLNADLAKVRKAPPKKGIFEDLF